MTKKTKKIIWWAVGLWCAICIVSALIYGPSDESQPAVQREAAPVAKTIKTDDDAALKRCKNLYSKLMSFKDSPEFRAYGFSENGDFHSWLVAAQNFTKDDDLHLMHTYGFVSGDIITLGQEYVSSKGKETDYTREKREELERIFSSETWEISE